MTSSRRKRVSSPITSIARPAAISGPSGKSLRSVSGITAIDGCASSTAAGGSATITATPAARRAGGGAASSRSANTVRWSRIQSSNSGSGMSSPATNSGGAPVSSQSSGSGSSLTRTRPGSSATQPPSVVRQTLASPSDRRSPASSCRRLAAPCSGPRSLQSLSCSQFRCRLSSGATPSSASRPCAFRPFGVISTPSRRRRRMRPTRRSSRSTTVSSPSAICAILRTIQKGR